MKTMLASILLTSIAAAGAQAQQTTFRDSRGSTIGTATRSSGGVTTFRNNRGSTTGTATRDSSGTTVFRNSRGRTTGAASGRR